MGTLQPKVKYRQDYRIPDYTITDLDLRFELDAENTVVTAISQVKRLAAHAVDLLLDGEALTLLEVKVDGQSWQHYRYHSQGLQLSQLPEQFELTIINRIHPDQNTALEGLYVSGGALCTQCEAEGFRRITYFLDRPDVLAKYRTYIVADRQQYPYLLSNGNRIDSGELADGRHWVQWEDPFPKPSYLFALVAGDFDILHDTFITHSGRQVALELYVDRGNLERAGWAMTSLKNAMTWDEQRFGLEYDLDIYMVVAVDFFNMGAMENKGLNVFNSKFVLAKAETATDTDYLNIESVIGHEYFHNWTGNRITCRDWFQLSLKEGLTVFRDQEFSSDLGSRGVNRIEAVKALRSLQFPEDAGPMSHPIRPDKVIEMNNFYTMTVYEKGAEVIRMLHTLLGEANFQAGMQRYIQQYDGSAATCDDFVQAMQDASAIDLSRFRRWYSQSGTPQLVVRDQYDCVQQRYTLKVHQFTPPTHDQTEKLPLHIPLAIELYQVDGQVIPLQYMGQAVNNVLDVMESEQTFVFDQVPERPIISLLQEFSAPVKLDYPYSDQQLIFLVQFATNDFSRWDAAQMLLMKYVIENVANYQKNKEVTLPEIVVDAFRGVLLDAQIDPALAALILTLPTENEMAEYFTVIDPDAIHAVTQRFMQIFAETMADEWLAVYRNYQQGMYQIEHQAMAQRALRNVCLNYIAFGEQLIAEKIVEEQYKRADNMTDALAAMKVAVNASLTCADLLLADFEYRWQQDGLVMDNWFALQAGKPTLETLTVVKRLLNHPTFSMNNPNRVRSLIGTFAARNPYGFHNKDASGYQFLAEILVDLNLRNPQIASRLIDALIRLKRYGTDREQLMRQALEKIASVENLSGNLFEKITKALEL